jgi:hypothetical protein
MSLALSERRVVPVDHPAFFVHFLGESKLCKSIGDGRKLIQAVDQHLAVHDAIEVANAQGPHVAGGASALGERLLNRGEDFAVIGSAGGLWDQVGGLAHEALSAPHRRVFSYVAKYLRKCADSGAVSV